MNKFFNNISYKNKVLCFSSLLLTTSIVCPLTSCGSDGTSNDIGGFDKEFGFDAQTYNSLERQFISKYGAYLKEKDIDKDVYINKFNNFLQNDLVILRNKLFDPAQNYSFTFRTNTLLEYASKNFNIQLNRNANISDIDFDNLRQSSLENFVIYMENMGFTKTEIDKRKTEFNKKFDDILKDCKSKTDDNAQILMQLRTDVIDCWQNLNDDIAYLSAYNHLKKFFDEYEFTVKDQEDNNNLWDNLLKNPDFMGSKENCGKIDQDINHPIGDDWIDKLFTISKKSQEFEKENNKDTPTNDNFSNATNSYSKEIIPGFILTPVLKTMSQNIYSNEYYMNIDWQLMHAKYLDKDQETKDKVTAHLATGKDEKAVDYDNFKNRQLPSDSYQFTRYSLKASPSYQQKVLNKAYFDPTKEPAQKITFSWNKDMFGIEYFLPSDAKSDNFEAPTKPYKVPMTRDNLSSIGLQLNGINLSDLLDKKTNLQDSQSAIKAINDNNLKIEEKFVKYCNINTIANVSFLENTLSNNTIKNDFIASFINTKVQYNVETKSNMNNIGPSKIFSNNAVNFYKQVVNYVDARKIEKNIEEWHLFSQIIQIELYILMGFCVLLLICIIVRCLYYYYHWKWQDHDPNQPPPQVGVTNSAKFQAYFIMFFFIAIITIALYLAWEYCVTDPISNEIVKVNAWNKLITERSQSSSDNKIEVIDKVNGEDKENFKSVDNFMSHYKKNSNTAFGSYFYYFYFIELSQNQTNDKQSTFLKDEKVQKDYKEFNDTKETYKIGDRKIGRVIIAIISLVIIVFAILLTYINIVLTRLLVGDWRIYLNVLNNAGAHVVGVLAPVGAAANPNMNPVGHIPPPVIPDNQNNVNDNDALIANVLEELKKVNDNKNQNWF